MPSQPAVRPFPGDQERLRVSQYKGTSNRSCNIALQFPNLRCVSTLKVCRSLLYLRRTQELYLQQIQERSLGSDWSSFTLCLRVRARRRL